MRLSAAQRNVLEALAGRHPDHCFVSTSTVAALGVVNWKSTRALETAGYVRTGGWGKVKLTASGVRLARFEGYPVKAG